MSGRAPNEVERKLHQAALSDPKKELTAKQSEAIVPDASARNNALNFLLGVGLFKVMKDANGSLLFRVVLKNEMNATKDLGGEENLVLNHIKASGNEGIWTKHLRAKTDLHQTVVDRCLKTLTQKQLIKAVKSVEHQTRKIYMLAHLEPSVKLTGGPWYTDNELDTEFIKLLCTACLRFIQDKSFPKRRSQQSQPQFFPISDSPQYPTAQTVQQFLKQARITETDLSVGHIEMLLNVLVLDGDIEQIPAYGASMWSSSAIADQADSEDEKRSKPKRKRRNDVDDDRKRKRRKKTSLESSSDDDSLTKEPKKKRKRKTRDSDSDSNDEKSKSKHRRKIRKRDETDDDSSEGEASSSQKKSKKKSKSKRQQDDSSSDAESLSSSSRTSPDPELHVKRGRSETGRSSKTIKRSLSPMQRSAAPFDDFDHGIGPTHVYRAIRQERVASGWPQGPCTKCPSFDFCNDKGPVNARDCVYFGDWLTTAPAANE